MRALERRAQELRHPDLFADRHIGPGIEDVAEMLAVLGLSTLDELVTKTVPKSILSKTPLDLPEPVTERAVMTDLEEIAAKNQVFRSYLGMGYHGCVTPPVIRRNVLENPGWYTPYTPYQAEIAQGRLEALINFQTLVMDLTAMDVANASLLDEATAAAEAMTLCRRVQEKQPEDACFVVSPRCHPQVIEVVKSRAEPLGIPVVVGEPESHDYTRATFGVLVSYPTTDGEVVDYAPLCERAHAAGALVVVCADLLALTLLRPPGEFGADVVVGSTQRFGVPLGYGGPHAAFMATRDSFKRQLAGRVVGVSKDATGRPAFRLALQTREQHIRRERATSNICTAQVLLAVIASMYAVYHGPDGLRRIASYVHALASLLARALEGIGYRPRSTVFFDTLRLAPGSRTQAEILDAARARGINLRAYDDGDVGIALDETVSLGDLRDLYEIFGGKPDALAGETLREAAEHAYPSPHQRSTPFLSHPVFNLYHSETELVRYLARLVSKDLSLTTSMIPLGSCTMKLNAAAEMFPISFAGFASLHPFAPPAQAGGYAEIFRRLERMLAEITGFDGVSLMPNAGAQGEYAGLLVIRAYHASRGEGHRKVCLIPVSALGTNPASAVLAGLRVVAVRCDEEGNVEIEDLRARVEEHRHDLAALMITYPSTHGVFEEGIREICEIVHGAGGQVYLDGANMNALIGLCRPAEIGADVCHLNLHKTFCIPHGGGGPGMGPVCAAKHLTPFLPGHPLVGVGGAKGIAPVSAAPWGSAGILPISYAYIAMMGASGLTRATRTAILSANYIARRLAPHFPLLFKGRNGFVAHECIVDVRPFRSSAGIEVEDVAKRLMDYGFHAPTMSWPVPGTLMIEPTESESRAELDRFCDAMIAIRGEVAEIEEGRADRSVNLLKMAPHTAEVVCSESWDRPYSRERAAFPAADVRRHKFWPAVSRIDNAYGDRNLFCSCPPMEGTSP
jgi:glycine dehydrogenase